jgi:hypothetical protein
VIGAVISGYGVGYLLGALLVGRFAGSALGRVMLVGNVTTAAALTVFALGGSPELEFAAAAATGVGGSLVLISYITLRATIPPDELLGRVGSTARTISLGLQPAGLFVGGVLLDAIGGGATLLLVAATVLAVTLLFSLSSTLRRATAGTGKRAA